MDKKKLKSSLYFLAISLIMMLCLNYIVTPSLGVNMNFSEGSNMSLGERAILFGMSVPLLSAYSVYTFKTYKNLKYFNFLNYPISIMVIWTLFMLVFLSVVGLNEYFLITIFLSIGATLYSVVMLLIGIGQDIKSWKAYIKNKKDKM